MADDKTRRELADRLSRYFNEVSNPDIPKLERHLMEIRDSLRRNAREQGYEV